VAFGAFAGRSSFSDPSEVYGWSQELDRAPLPFSFSTATSLPSPPHGWTFLAPLITFLSWTEPWTFAGGVLSWFQPYLLT